MGSQLTSPNIKVEDLPIFSPNPWPSEHHDKEGKVLPFQENGRYINPWMKDRPSPAKFFISRKIGPNNLNIPRSKTELDEKLPVHPPPWMPDPGNFRPTRARVTWLGHATILAEVDGQTVLCDPLFSDRASAVQFAGPQRYRPPPCGVTDLPHISAVVISHNHYDHLDLNTVKTLVKLQPNIVWFVPMGTGQWMKDNTVVQKDKVKEMTWWQEEELDETQLRIVMTPANHWCKRGIGDDNKMLWGSWAVMGPTTRFWFGGDTGYCEAFKQIGDKFGPFDLAAIPIGNYQPNWFMKYQHVHPGEAVEIHKDIRSRKSIGIHWGTYKFWSTENYLEPPSVLPTLLSRSGLNTKEFFTIHSGESFIL